MSNSKFFLFLKKNMRWYHVIGIFLGALFSYVYWLKSGQFSDYILKNNIFLILLWGIIIGYVSFDIIFSSSRKIKKQ